LYQYKLNEQNEADNATPPVLVSKQLATHYKALPYWKYQQFGPRAIAYK